MKLLFCTNCQDLFRLTGTKRSCTCGKSSGSYVDNLNAEVFGDKVVMVGFDNTSFVKAVKHRPFEGKGIEFKAFVIPRVCDTIRWTQSDGRIL